MEQDGETAQARQAPQEGSAGLVDNLHRDKSRGVMIVGLTPKATPILMLFVLSGQSRTHQSY